MSYRTLHRYAVTELEFGRRRATVPVADSEPGAEVHIGDVPCGDRADIIAIGSPLIAFRFFRGCNPEANPAYGKDSSAVIRVFLAPDWHTYAASLKFVPERKLHYTRIREQAAIRAKRTGRNVSGNCLHVKPLQVRYVKHLPAE